MDTVLDTFWKEIGERTLLEFPRFAKEAACTAPFLAVLETPGKSGAEKSGECSLDNKDPTAKRTREIIEAVRIPREQIVFWNFYAAYKQCERSKKNRKLWAGELERLIEVMPKLKAIVVFGNDAWHGMRDVNLRKGIALIGAPHPSNRAINNNCEAKEEIRRAWKRAKALLE